MFTQIYILTKRSNATKIWATKGKCILENIGKQLLRNSDSHIETFILMYVCGFQTWFLQNNWKCFWQERKKCYFKGMSKDQNTSSLDTES